MSHAGDYSYPLDFMVNLPTLWSERTLGAKPKPWALPKIPVKSLSCLFIQKFAQQLFAGDEFKESACSNFIDCACGREGRVIRDYLKAFYFPRAASSPRKVTFAQCEACEKQPKREGQ